jgi:hypothetical protein
MGDRDPRDQSPSAHGDDDRIARGSAREIAEGFALPPGPPEALQDRASAGAVARTHPAILIDEEGYSLFLHYKPKITLSLRFHRESRFRMDRFHGRQFRRSSVGRGPPPCPN